MLFVGVGGAKSLLDLESESSRIMIEGGHAREYHGKSERVGAHGIDRVPVSFLSPLSSAAVSLKGWSGRSPERDFLTARGAFEAAVQRDPVSG